MKNPDNNTHPLKGSEIKLVARLGKWGASCGSSAGGLITDAEVDSDGLEVDDEDEAAADCN